MWIAPHFRGCISIKKSGKVLLEEAYGYSDLSNEISNTLETKFATASAGKVFVAVGILQLIEKGKLSLHSTIGELIDIDWHDIDKNITVRELLNHTSGIPDYFDESIMEEYADLWEEYPNYKIRESKDLLPLFIHKSMMYKKGTKFQYNNTGFVVLGLIIEAVTGKKFDEYLKQSIFNVLGMKNTGYYELDRLPAKCANHYIFDDTKKEYYTNIYSVDVKGTGAGGAFTTIGDVELFWKGLLSYQLLSKDMTTEMLKIQSATEEEDNYGYGIWLSKRSKTNQLAYFTGSDLGVSFISCYKLDEDILITLISNYGDDVWNIAGIARNILCHGLD